MTNPGGIRGKGIPETSKITMPAAARASPLAITQAGPTRAARWAAAGESVKAPTMGKTGEPGDERRVAQDLLQILQRHEEEPEDGHVA
jgi:hypothetical protein